MQSDVISGTKMPSSDVDVNLLETIDEVKWRSRRRVRASEEPDRTINGNQRQSTAINGNRRQSTAIDGNQQHSTAIKGRAPG
jgi:hypothetical protein